MTDLDLPIPARPYTRPPTLKQGWQWVNTHWAAYWLMKYQGIDNRPKNLNISPDYIKTTLSTLHWFERHHKTKHIFQQILKTNHYSEPAKFLDDWYSQAGLFIPEKGYAPPLQEIVLRNQNESLTRQEVINSYFIKPINFSRSSREPFGDGRHRTYAAWKHGLPDVFMWISL